MHTHLWSLRVTENGSYLLNDSIALYLNYSIQMRPSFHEANIRCPFLKTYKSTEFMPMDFDGSLAEIEKIYEIAINGSDEEKISAATILCGASLVRGWNVQVLFLAFQLFQRLLLFFEKVFFSLFGCLLSLL